MPTCFICQKNISTLKSLQIHFQIIHRLHKKSQYRCGEEACIRIFPNIHSYRRHWNLMHIIPKSSKVTEDVTYENIVVKDRVNDNESLEFVKPDLPLNNVTIRRKNNHQKKLLVQESQKFLDFDFKGFEKLFKSNTLLFITKLYNAPSIPRNHVQLIIDMTHSLMFDGLSKLHTKVIDELQTLHSNSENLQEINKMFQTLENPFKGIETEYKRFKELEERGFLIQAEDYIVGHRFQKGLPEDGHVAMDPTEVKAKFFPLRKIFKKLFEMPHIYDAVMSYKSTLENEKNIISNFVQGKFWQSKQKSHEGKNVLPLIISFDDYETGNPLGSHAGVHKVGATYVLIPCFPPEYQACLSSIYIALLFYSSDRKEFGNNAIFYKLINELKFLQEIGIELELPQGKVILYFELGSLTADNLGMHQLLGYIESFQGNYACRFCIMYKTERSKCCVADLSLLRDHISYEEDLLKNNSSKTGIKEKSVFSELPGFHVTTNLSVDFMHDGPEGFLSFDMLEIIEHYTKKTVNFFTLSQLNNIILAYDFGPYCSNVPPPISFQHMKEGKIRMSAAEMLTFVRHFGLMVGHFVPKDDPVWNFFLIARQLTDILTSPALHRDCSKLLRVLIKEHNSLFLQLFNKPLKPKAHHLVHYPEAMDAYGPVIHLQSMRSESKHRESKITAVATNCKINVCATLALKHQLRLAHQFLSKSVFCDTLQIGPTRDVLLSTLTVDWQENIFEQPVILIANWIKHFKNKYQRGSVVCIGEDEDENCIPRFGVIVHVALDKNKKVFLLYDELDIISFDEHFYAYECICHNADLLQIIQLERLLHSIPTSIIREQGKNYIILRKDL